MKSLHVYLQVDWANANLTFCMCAHVCVCTHTGDQKRSLSVLFYHPLPYFLETGSFSEPKAHSLAGMADWQSSS